MHIFCLGINHNTADIKLRERLAFSQNRTEAALARLGCGNKQITPIQEMIILSTCNRVEIYAVGVELTFPALENFLAGTSEVAADEFSQHVYRLLDEEAVSHLMRVAAGLDSLVLGEPQILGQVTEAFSIARSQGTTGKILSRLFQNAIHAGKRARTETTISHNPASIASVAVMLISNVVPEIACSQVLVLGAGEMAELSVESLIKRGASQICVVNRTLQKAQECAHRWGAQAATFESISNLLPIADVLISSTAAPHTLIHPSMVKSAMEQRPQRPLVIMDIAVPRDVDVQAAEIPGVSLYDLDSLSAGLQESLAKRQAEVPKVERILEHEKGEFMKYLASLDIVPIIVGMRKQAHSIRVKELKKTIQRLPDLSPEARESIELLTKSIVKKILHSPTIRLREEANGPNAADYANITRGLFGLD
jgi:glutamyl-tRNA reductase